MPTAETKNPPEKHSADANIDLRGPTRSTQRPKTAADEPRKTMAIEKIQPTSFKFQSPGAVCVSPMSLVSGRLKVENAYACPMHRCTARAAGGTRNRLKPGPATVFSRARNVDDISGPVLFWGLLRGGITLLVRQYALFPAILSPSMFAGRLTHVNWVTLAPRRGIRRIFQCRSFKTVTLDNERIRGNP